MSFIPILLLVLSSCTFAQYDTSKLMDIQIAAVWEPGNVGSDADWTNAIAKGKRLMCRLDATDEGAGRLWEDARDPPSAQALWPDYMLNTDLKLWSWYPSDCDQVENCNFGDDDDSDGHENKIGTALQSLGSSLKPLAHGGDNICFNIQHYDDKKTDDDGDQLEPEDQYYTVDGKNYRCTGAHVRFSINRVGGIIMGHDFSSPRNEAEVTWDVKTVQENELPQLKRASDVMMAFWLRDNNNPRNLRYYLANQITNKQTTQLIARVLKDANLLRVPKWPGLEVSMQKDEGLALLGNPLGGTLAFLIAQHKAELGIKHITSVTIFRDNNDDPDDNDPHVYMLYKIEDVQEIDISVQAGHIGDVVLPRGQGELKNIIRTHTITNRDGHCSCAEGTKIVDETHVEVGAEILKG